MKTHEDGEEEAGVDGLEKIEVRHHQRDARELDDFMMGMSKRGLTRMRRQSWKRDQERRESRKSFRDSDSLHHCIAREVRVVSDLDASSFERRRRAQNETMQLTALRMLG